MLTSIIDLTENSIQEINEIFSNHRGNVAFILTGATDSQIQEIISCNYENLKTVVIEAEHAISANEICIIPENQGFNFDGNRILLKNKEFANYTEIVAKNFPDGSITLLDKTHTILFTDGEGYHKYNIDPQSFIGRPAQSALSDHVYLDFINALQRKNGSEVIEYETIFKRNIFRNTCKTIKDEQGEILYHILKVIDITALKRSEEQVRTLLTENLNLLNSIDGVIWEANPKHLNTVFVSPQSETILGYSSSEWLSTKNFWPNHIHPDDQGRIRDYLDKNLFKKNKHVLEYRFQHKSGKYLWIKDSIDIEIVNEEPKSIRGIMVDITELKESNQQLQDSEEKFDLISKNTSDGIAIFEESKMTYASDSYVKIQGYTRNELFSQDVECIYNSIHPEDRDTVFTRVKKAIKKGFNSVTYEYRRIHKLGHYIWREDTTSFIYNESGESIKQIVIGRDITEKKKAELELLESRELISSVSNNIPGLIMSYISHPDGSDSVDYVSEGALKLWGIDKEAVLKDTSKVWAKVHPEDLVTISEVVAESAKSLTTAKVEYRITNEDGSYKWITSVGQPRLLEDGSIKWYTVALDITEQKNNETALSNTLSKLEKTLATLNLAINYGDMAIWEMDMNTGELIWSEQALALYEVEDFSKIDRFDKFKDLVEEEDYLEIEDKKEKVLLENEGFKKRIQIKTSKGVKYLETTGAPANAEEGANQKFIGITRDITKAVQRQLELENILNEKENLFRELHHRIKNNLQMVVSLLYIKESGTKDADLAMFIKETTSKIQSISQIHEQLLQLEGINKLDLKEYLHKLIANLIDAYSSSENQVQLQVDIESIDVEIDKVLCIGLIVNEIISNSIKYGFPNAKSGEITFNLKAVDDHLDLQIGDNGVGISDDKLSDYENSYGLQLINVFAEQLAAKMSVDNKNGTKYSFKIPR